MNQRDAKILHGIEGSREQECNFTEEKIFYIKHGLASIFYIYSSM